MGVTIFVCIGFFFVGNNIYYSYQFSIFILKNEQNSSILICVLKYILIINFHLFFHITLLFIFLNHLLTIYNENKNMWLYFKSQIEILIPLLPFTEICIVHIKFVNSSVMFLFTLSIIVDKIFL